MDYNVIVVTTGVRSGYIVSDRWLKAETPETAADQAVAGLEGSELTVDGAVTVRVRVYRYGGEGPEYDQPRVVNDRPDGP